MKLNEKKFFELCKLEGIEASDLTLVENYSLNTSVFHGEVDSYTENSTTSLNARGIINGKFGAVTTEIIDKDTIPYLIKNIKESASLIETNNPAIIFKGSEKYHKKNLFNPAVLDIDVKDAISKLLEIEKKLLAFDKRISEVVTVAFGIDCTTQSLSNSYGLKLKDKQATYSYVAEVTAKQDDETRTGFKVFASYDVNEFDLDKFVKEVAEDALKRLGSTQCDSKKYPIVLDQRCTATMLRFLLNSIDAEQIQKDSSLLKGKLNQPIASKKLTVIENPLQKNIFFRYFDDEGVATNKKTIVEKGVLKTYIYTLETAAKDGVEPTGNGYRGSSKAHADLQNLVIKPGKKSFDDMIAPIAEGVFIDELNGLHAGINAQSGNFSLQASGFMIRNGKLAEPLALITIAGNLFEMFMNIKEIANDSKLLTSSSTTAPSICFKKMSITGK